MDENKKAELRVPKIGLLDSGIGGFSILKELIEIFPEAHYFYYCDEAHAPYGPQTDEYITQRSFEIVDVLLKRGVEMIVVACNTATAASIDSLRARNPEFSFVGVEPYLTAYFKEEGCKKMAVLTTESTGKSERFKRLRERLDPSGHIDHYSLKNLARMVEELYWNPAQEKDFDQQLEIELAPLHGKGYTHSILACTHYPLVRHKIESVLSLKTICPCPYVAQRVKELCGKRFNQGLVLQEIPETFEFFSSRNQHWELYSRDQKVRSFKK